jgi:hypothetical protein
MNIEQNAIGSEQNMLIAFITNANAGKIHWPRPNQLVRSKIWNTWNIRLCSTVSRQTVQIRRDVILQAGREIDCSHGQI